MDKKEEVKEILRNSVISWYREDKEEWIEAVATGICCLFPMKGGMKCIACGKEAKYLYIYGLPITGISFLPEGGSYCSECLSKVKEKEGKDLADWVKFHEEVKKK